MGFSGKRFRKGATVAVFLAAAASPGVVGAAEPEDTSAELAGQAKAIFGVLPGEAVDPRRPVTEERIALGRKLYFDPRFVEKIRCAIATFWDAESLVAPRA